MKKYLFIILLSQVQLASAITYYVATNGSDMNNGRTLSTPYATVAKGLSMLKGAGDTLFIRGGVYMQTGFLGIGASGTRGRNVCVWAYPPDYESGNHPILDYRNVVLPSPTNYSCISITGRQYVHIKGLTVRNLFQRRTGGYLPQGFSAVNCANITFENCTAHDISGRGFWYFSGAWNAWDGANAPFQSDTTYFVNCDAYNLCDSLSSTPGNAADGFKVGGYLGNVIYFYGCRAWNYTDDGFDPSGPATRIFESCWATSTKKYVGTGMMVEGNGFKTAAMWNSQASYINSGTNYVQIRNCIAAYCHGIGFYNNLEPGLQNNALYQNNTAYRNHTGFADIITNVTRTSKYYNNIAIYSTSRGQGFDPLYEVAIYYPNVYPSATNNWVADGGSQNWPGWKYNPAFSVTNDDFISIDSSQIRLPRKPDGSLPDITFLRLAPGSDLIDAGTNVGLSYYGSAPDIGYSEYVAGPVTHPAPAFVSALIQNSSPDLLEMSYILNLANIVPHTSAFTVTVNSIPITVVSVGISGTKVLLRLSSPVNAGDIVTVSYTKPATNPLQTPAGGVAESLSPRSVANNVTSNIPLYISSVIENETPTRLEMTYDVNLANILPSTSAFSVRVNSFSRNVTSVTIVGNKVRLILASAVVNGDVITVSYSKPLTNMLQSTSGGQAASLSTQPVTNRVNPAIPVFVGAVVENSAPGRIEMTYNLTLANVIPSNAAFTVLINSNARSINSVLISGSKVMIGLTSPVLFGDVITVSYSKPASNPLQTPNGGQAQTIQAQPVINNVSLSSNNPPTVSIISPSPGASYYSADFVRIDAIATDTDGTISTIEFFSGTNRLGEKSTPPYFYIWANPTEGAHALTAVATDNSGAKTISIPVTINIVKKTDPIDELIAGGINLYPNPNNGQFTIEVTSEMPINAVSTASVLTISGSKILQMAFPEGQISDLYDISDSPSGIYVFVLKSGSRIIATRKFIKL